MAFQRFNEYELIFCCLGKHPFSAPLTSMEVSFIITLILGFALGSFSAGLVSDRFGRRTAVWGASVTMFVFGLITSFIPW